MSRYSGRGTDCEGGFSEVSMGCEREVGVSRADRFCGGGLMGNVSSERQEVSPGECSARDGHRSWLGPPGRMSLIYEH